MNQQIISNKQFFFIVFVSITCLSFFSSPNQLTSQVKQDLWLSMIFGTLIDIYVAYILQSLGNQYKGKTIIQYTGSILGKAAGKIVSLCYLLFFLIVMMTAMWIYCDFMSRSLMPETPQLVFSLTMMFCAGMATWIGIEAIARLSQLIGAIVLVASIILFICSIADFRIENLLPVLEDGILPPLRGAIYPGSWFGICITVAMLMPHLSNPSKMFWMKSKAVVLGAFIMTIYLMYSIAVMGPDMAGKFENPIYIFSRITHLIILDRVEVLLLLIFIFGSLITISIVFFAFTKGMQQWTGSKSPKPWIIIFGIIVVFSPFAPFSHNSPVISSYLSYWFPIGALCIEGGLTTMLFIIAMLRRHTG
ncbi:endospore germination permease [Paenibacillus sp. GCM10012307]|uniref:Endospore germination permease n=1 Tax=Paenibacillus roseus TaxID=2798579 RepID=A0A934MTR0_9BACL|nr:endospore germination permease [Paenibacillus roseus]MBJ6360312.1 endospore germination permease [Paenibacillus roseus]